MSGHTKGPMNTMVERVEKAIDAISWPSRRKWQNCEDVFDVTANEGLLAKGWVEVRREIARAAIEAMREPTEDMFVAWIENTAKIADAEPTGRDQLAACKSDWQAMIDVCLQAGVGDELD